tara:strand:- start:239 stop:460 length:222 start_codon:yes stop_codon:yes gene_type:complete
MNKGEFEKLHMCEFKPDEEQAALDERLMQYYRETDECDNRYALDRWKEFKAWAIGYSQQEINMAKKRCSGRRL